MRGLQALTADHRHAWTCPCRMLLLPTCNLPHNTPSLSPRSANPDHHGTATATFMHFTHTHTSKCPNPSSRRIATKMHPAAGLALQHSAQSPSPCATGLPAAAQQAVLLLQQVRYQQLKPPAPRRQEPARAAHGTASCVLRQAKPRHTPRVTHQRKQLSAHPAPQLELRLP